MLLGGRLVRAASSSLLPGSCVAHDAAGVDVDVAARVLDRLEVEPRRPDHVVADAEDHHAAHEERPAVRTRTGHLPFRPQLVAVETVARHVGSEVGNGEELRPVPANLLVAAEGPWRMDG